MNRKILSLFVIAAMFAGTKAEASYYDFQEIQGQNGTEIIIYSGGARPTTAQSAQTNQAVSTINNTAPAQQKVWTQDDFPIFEKQVQREYYAQSNIPYYTDWSPEEAMQIVQKVGLGLKQANNIDLQLTFLVVNDEEVNACTDINNNIYVFSGILPFLENEDELAFVIGHEIGHAASKHVMKSIVTNTTAGTVNEVGKKVVAEKLGKMASTALGKYGGYGIGELADKAVVGAANTGLDVTTAATTSALERGRENDADLLAVDYLVKKGYNPLAGISIMSKICENYPDFFADHPSTDKRVANVYEYIQKKYPSYITKEYETKAYRTAIAEYKQNKR